MCGETPRTRSPFTKMLPPVAGKSPAMTLSSVDFPHPDGPTMLRNSPFSTEKEMSSKAVISPFSA